MCMYDDGGGWKVYNEATRRAAKEHECSECHRTIAKGETYHYVSGLGYDYDAWYTNRMCAHCREMVRWLLKECGGFMFEMTWEDLRNHIDGDESEMRSAPLVRILRWGLADWRNPAGELRDVADVAAVVDRAIAKTEAMTAQYAA